MKNYLALILSFITIYGYSQSSVLSNGEWYKIGVTASGIYRIDRNFLEEIGINASSINPLTFQIYGNGGEGPLPQSNSESRPVDLIENSIYFQGNSDETWESNEFFLFYGNEPHLKRTNSLGEFEYEENIYSDTTYYFLTFNQENGLRVEVQERPGGQFTNVDSYQEHLVFEENTRNILKNLDRRGGSGREWYGQTFQRNVSLGDDYRFDAEGFLGSGAVTLSALSQAFGPASLTVSVNGSEFGELSMGSIRPPEEAPYDDKGVHHSGTFPFSTNSSNDLEVGLTYNPFPDDISVALLDKILVQYDRTLALYGQQTIFRSIEAMENESVTYQIQSSNSAVQIWDITQPTNPATIDFNTSGNQITFNEVDSALHEYIIFSGNDFPSPEFFQEIQNQNIRGLSTPDAIIISDPLFRREAERLANLHRGEGLDVLILSPFEIYNEFSSGMQDITAIRDAVKYFWDQSNSLGNVLLFGDCSYDYKDRIPNNTNFVPGYQSRNSVHPIFSYSSDDYFGFLEDNEGFWFEQSFGDHTMEIGVGRIPVKTVQEAEDIVDKIIRYSTSPNVMGNWKNSVTYVVDDGDRNIHVQDAEEVNQIFREMASQTVANKVYLDAFQQDVGPSETTSEETASEFLEALENGTFIVNYIGHGNEFQWMDEDIFDTTSINGLSNRFQLPLFITATCQFGRYDDPTFFSGSERLLLNPNGGAIALITTTRPVFSSTNRPVNESFHEAIFNIENGEYPRLGDVIRQAKNSSLRGPVNRNFALLGDPMLRLAYPNYQAEITEINGVDITQDMDTLSALESITIQGQISDLNGSLVEGFNGVVSVNLYDSERSLRTKGQESAQFTYSDQTNALFRGEASVTDGTFSLTFSLSRNITYRFEPGKFVLYAVDESNQLDATGALENFVLGGTDPEPVVDNTPPTINMFLNDEDFNNGDRVSQNSILIARIFDENGINISDNGINQNITLTINTNEPLVINDFYTADLDDFSNGSVVFPLRGLEAGRYSATIKVWDNYNNSESATVDFVVSDNTGIQISNVINFPNPARSETTFVLQHDRAGEALEVGITVYDVFGDIVEQLDFEVDNGLGEVNDLHWNIVESGLRPGVYFYRLTVTSTLDGAVGQEVKRLIVN